MRADIFNADPIGSEVADLSGYTGRVVGYLVAQDPDGYAGHMLTRIVVQWDNAPVGMLESCAPADIAQTFKVASDES